MLRLRRWSDFHWRRRLQPHGKLDIAASFVVPAGATGTALLFGNGGGTFQTAVLPTDLQDFVMLLVADLNNDGKPDLISRSSVAPGNGDGTFTAPATIADEVDAIADINGDGIADAVTAKYQNASAIGVGSSWAMAMALSGPLFISRRFSRHPFW